MLILGRPWLNISFFIQLLVKIIFNKY